MVKLILRKPTDKPKTWYFEQLPSYSKELGSFYMDGGLMKRLERCKLIIRKDMDYVFVVDGYPGTGKSVFTMGMAYFVSNGNFCMEDICFNANEFKDRVMKAEKYSAIIFDEAFRGASKKAWATLINRTVANVFQEIRQKNLFIFIVLPSIWDLESSLAMFRCKGLFNVTAKSTATNIERGYFRSYGRKQLMYMFKNDKKFRYTYPRHCMSKGRFTEFYPIDQIEYRNKKNSNLGAVSIIEEKPESKPKELMGSIYSKLLDKGMSFKDIAKLYSLEVSSVKTAVRRSINSQITASGIPHGVDSDTDSETNDRIYSENDGFDEEDEED